MTDRSDAEHAALEAWSLMSVKRHDDALKALQRGLASEPDNSGLHALVCEANFEMGDYGAALSAADRVVALTPGEELGHRLRAAALGATRRHLESEISAREAIRLDPASYSAYLALFGALLGQRKFSEAEKAVGRLRELAPQEGDSFNAAGLLLLEQRRPWEAQEQFRLALSAQPDNALYHNNLAAALLRQYFPRRSESINILHEAVRLVPSGELAQRNLIRAIRNRMRVWGLVTFDILFGLGFILLLETVGPDSARAPLSPPAAHLATVLGVVVLVLLLPAGVILSRWWVFRRLPAGVQLFYKSQR